MFQIIVVTSALLGHHVHCSQCGGLYHCGGEVLPESPKLNLLNMQVKDGLLLRPRDDPESWPLAATDLNPEVPEFVPGKKWSG